MGTQRVSLCQGNPTKLCPPAEIVGNSTHKLTRGLLVWLISVRQTLILFFGEDVVKMIFIYFFIIFNWRIIALQCCVGFCHIST